MDELNVKVEWSKKMYGRFVAVVKISDDSDNLLVTHRVDDSWSVYNAVSEREILHRLDGQILIAIQDAVRHAEG